jgi:hypothetical protein
VSNDDVLFGFRLRLFALAAEVGVRPTCRAMGVHHSTITAGSAASTAGAWRRSASASGGGRRGRCSAPARRAS